MANFFFELDLAGGGQRPKDLRVRKQLVVGFELRHPFRYRPRRLIQCAGPTIRPHFEKNIYRKHFTEQLEIVPDRRLRDVRVPADIVGILPAAKFKDPAVAVDIRTTAEAGLALLPDYDVLRIAADSGRVLVIEDRRTMPSQFRRFLAAGRVRE